MINLKPLNAVIAKCDYSMIRSIGSDNILECKIKNLIVDVTNRKVSSVTGNLILNGVTYELEDVKQLTIEHDKCEFMPSGFGTHFPNLERILFTGGNLKALTHENLMEFPNLRYLDAGNNKIER